MSSSKKTAVKSTKNGKTAKKAPKSKVVSIGDAASARIYKVKKQFADGGVRADFVKAIPKSGASLADIAKKAKLDLAKARSYAYWLASNGYLTRVAA